MADSNPRRSHRKRTRYHCTTVLDAPLNGGRTDIPNDDQTGSTLAQKATYPTKVTVTKNRDPGVHERENYHCARLIFLCLFLLSGNFTHKFYMFSERENSGESFETNL